MLMHIFYHLTDDNSTFPFHQWKLYANDALVVTDNQSVINFIQEEWSYLGPHETDILPIIGIESSDSIHLSGCSYIVTDVSDLDEEYLDRIYRRVHRLPWTVIETSRCILRETTQEDIDRLYELYSHPSITQYMEPLYPEKEAEAAYLKDYQDHMYAFYGFGVWSILEKSTGLLIGRAGISMREAYEEPELGFCIDYEHQRKGLAREVCLAILQFMKINYDLPAIQALVQHENIASIRLLTSLGFHFSEAVQDKEQIFDRYIIQL